MTDKEAIINPNLPICDAHHHLWDRPDNRYLVEDFLRDTGSGHRIVSSVFIGCKTMYRRDGPPELQPVGETEFIERITAPTQNSETKVAAGIVGFADLALGEAVAPVLEAHIVAGKGRFRGIRSNKWLGNPKWLEGFSCLGRYNLSFDAWQTGSLTEVADLARVFPNTTIILNHIGGAFGIGPFSENRKEVLDEWRRGMTALAECHNVVVKLGGLGMGSFGFGWAGRENPPDPVEIAKAIAPYCLECIKKFGTSRCMFESNFPVDRVSYSYDVIWNAFKLVVKGFSPGEQSALFYENARGVYHL
jgi:predicted TIM-barrel fold metal-dependent hydrolase